MPRTDTRPTIPSDQDALLAREASLAIATQHADMNSLKLQLASAGKEVTTVRLPEAAAKLLLQLLTELGNGLRMIRTSWGVRQMTVRGRYVLSVYQCSCYGGSDAQRVADVGDWSGQIDRELQGSEHPTAS